MAATAARKDNSASKRARSACTALWLVLFLLALAPAAWASHVTPEEVESNPSCADLGYDNELKVEDPGDGSFSDGTLTAQISGSQERSFSWSSDIAVDAVIVKGGPDANVYRYDPAATSDENLTPPDNPANGQPYGVSHISFCYNDADEQQGAEQPSNGKPGAPGNGKDDTDDDVAADDEEVCRDANGDGIDDTTGQACTTDGPGDDDVAAGDQEVCRDGNGDGIDDVTGEACGTGDGGAGDDVSGDFVDADEEVCQDANGDMVDDVTGEPCAAGDSVLGTRFTAADTAQTAAAPGALPLTGGALMGLAAVGASLAAGGAFLIRRARR